MKLDGIITPFNFLSDLQLSERDALQKIADTHLVLRKRYIFRAGDLSDTIYILQEGRVKITRLSKQGRELIQWFCLPGEIFGFAESYNTHRREMYAQALTDAKLLRINKANFEQYLLQNPCAALLIVRQLAIRLHTLGDMLLNATNEDAHSRFIGLLQRLSEFHGEYNESGVRVDFYLTHQEMADMIGVCRQTVSSMISKLKQHGHLKTDRRGIHITHPTELFRLTPPNMTTVTSQ